MSVFSPSTFFFFFRSRKEHRRRWRSSFAPVRLHTTPPPVKLAQLSDLYLNKPRNSLLSWDFIHGGVTDGGSCRTISDIPEQWSNLHDYNNTNCNYEKSTIKNSTPLWALKELLRCVQKWMTVCTGGVVLQMVVERLLVWIPVGRIHLTKTFRYLRLRFNCIKKKKAAADLCDKLLYR